MDVRKGVVQLVTEEPAQPEVAHEFVSESLTDGLEGGKVVSNKGDAASPEYPTCIFRGSERQVGYGLSDDDFWHTRKTLAYRIYDALYRCFARR